MAADPMPPVPSTRLVALSSDELMHARSLAYDPRDDALDPGTFLHERMEAEDDCLVARHVVPLDAFAPDVWNAVATDIYADGDDDRDIPPVDKLIEARGLFPHDPARGPRRIALFSTELGTALGHDLDAGCPRVPAASSRIRVLDSLSGFEPDFYTDPGLISPAGWNRLSGTIFERSCTARDGTPFEILFDRTDLTTGTPLAHARARLSELEAALAERGRGDDEGGPFDTYLAGLAESLLAAPGELAALRHEGAGLSIAVTALLGTGQPTPDA
ncbi:hypothetical protein [Sphingomonas oryzagri]